MKKRKQKPTIKSYPFGGLINKGTTNIASALGADPRTAQLIGSGVATASGFIPGMQDNLLQGGDFVGDITDATGNEDLQTFGQVARTGSQIATMFPNGGMINNPLPQVEKQEVMRAPDGSTMQVDGPTHAQGGVDVNLPSGTEVFSDRLKMPGQKKTYAKLAEKFKTNKEEKILSDDKATNMAKATAKLVNDIKQRKLTELFNSQESLKQSKVDAYSKKIGINPEMKYGGAIPDYANYANGGLSRSEDYGSKNKPYPSVETNDFAGGDRSYPIPTKADAVDALRLAGLHGRADVRTKVYNRYPELKKYAMGGKVCYPNGGMIYNPDGTYRFVGGNKPGAALDSFNTEVDAINAQYSNTRYDNSLTRDEAKANWFADTANYDPTTGESARSADRRFNERYDRQDAVPTIPSNQLNTSQPTGQGNNFNVDSNLATTGASFLAQNAGNIYDLYKSNMGKDYDKVNYGQVNPSLLSDKQSLMDADIQAKVSRGQIAGAVGGNAGAYLSNVNQVGSANTLNKSRIRQDFQNRNAEITNQAKYFNKNLDVRAQEAEAANKGQTSTIARDAVRDIGYKAGAGINDVATAKMDERTLGWISKMYPNFTFNEKQGWFFDAKGQPLDVNAVKPPQTTVTPYVPGNQRYSGMNKFQIKR